MPGVHQVDQTVQIMSTRNLWNQDHLISSTIAVANFEFSVQLPDFALLGAGAPPTAAPLPFCTPFRAISGTLCGILSEISTTFVCQLRTRSVGKETVHCCFVILEIFYLSTIHQPTG